MVKDLSIAQEFKRRALQAMPRRVAKIVLYGSRARGDAREDSDWDVAVFIKGRPTREIGPFCLTSVSICIMETGEHVQAFPFPIRHEKLDYSFYSNVRADGIAV